MPKVLFRAVMGGIGLVSLMASLSCGARHTLVAITIAPSGFTYTNPQVGPLATFVATGQFIHPPGNRDISKQVVWSNSFPAIFTVDPSTGVATYLGGCGTNLPVTATASTDLHLPPSGNIVIGTALVNITQTGCKSL